MRAAFTVLSVVIFGACATDTTTSPTPTASAAAAPSWAGRGGVYDTIGRPLAQARVEVLDGQHRGLAILTDEQGRYEFDTLFTSSFNAKATKAGYRDEVAAVRGPDNPGWFHLDSVNGSTDFTGEYVMTFAADAACMAIPGYARRRTVAVVNTRNSRSSYLVSVAGGQYGAAAPGGGYFNNVLYAGVFEDVFALYLSDPPLWERFPHGSYLIVSGQATGSIIELPARLLLDGGFTYCAEMAPGNEPRCAVSEVTCRSSNHQLTIAGR